MVYECFLKCGKLCTPLETISSVKWERLESKTLNWSGLDKYGDIHKSTNWKNGPSNQFMHDACYIIISSKDKLDKAQTRKRKILAEEINSEKASGMFV